MRFLRTILDMGLLEKSRPKRPCLNAGAAAYAHAVKVPDPDAFIAALSPHALCSLLAVLAIRAVYEGIPAQIYAMAMGEAARRYIASQQA